MALVSASSELQPGQLSRPAADALLGGLAPTRSRTGTSCVGSPFPGSGQTQPQPPISVLGLADCRVDSHPLQPC